MYDVHVPTCMLIMMRVMYIYVEQLGIEGWNLFLLKPQDSFGRFVKIVIDLQKADHIPSESTIKPTGNCFEWHVVTCTNTQ